MIALNSQPIGKAGADIILRPRDAGVRERSPNGERRRIVEALRRSLASVYLPETRHLLQ
jgi:hypothetical protein